MSSEYTFPNPFVPEKRRLKPNRKLIYGLCSALVFLLLLFAALALYIQFDVFKSPKLIYLQSEVSTIESWSQDWLKLWEDWAKDGTLNPDQPIHSVLELSDVQIDPDASGEFPPDLLDVIAKSQLVMDTQEDAGNHQFAQKLDWYVDDTSFLGIESAMDSEKVLFRIPAIYDKYGYIQAKDIDEMKKRFQMGAFPKRVVSLQEWLDALGMDSDEFSRLMLPYGKLYADGIASEQVTLNKNGVLEEAGTSVKCRELTISFSNEDMKRLMSVFADKLADDQELQNKLYDRLLSTRLLISDSGYPVKYLEKEQFLQQWKQLAAGFKQVASGQTLRDGLTMKVYIDRHHRILQRKLDFDVKDGVADEAVTVKLGSWKANSSLTYTLLSIASTNQQQGDKEEITFLHTQEVDDSRMQGKVALNMKLHPEDQAVNETDFSAQLAYDRKTLADRETSNYHFKIRMPEEIPQSPFNYEGDITVDKTRQDPYVTERNSRIRLGIYSAEDQLSHHLVDFKLHHTLETGAPVRIPLLSEDNSINLGQMSDQDMEGVYRDIGQGIQRLAQEHQELLRVLGVPAALFDRQGSLGESKAPRSRNKLST
ncbi:DUF6583 family protein [Paenibacillus hexagrammi]|uniref:Uncharacterized protein n=1 Tax=Paenibacillus hexagrammi TaxID=2908839 RepID=A0ABY3SGP1_9BACL|nr:DUF6583 family protein [Paenibacillus sp. YPD9-1]UJF33157.1 hypothetical protein L0M14_27060 [Paenibacillus sp. YPD9-1]